MISTQNLIFLFQNTLNPNTIQQATQTLQSIKHYNGFSKGLFEISQNSNLQLTIRMAGTIYLKNLVQYHCRSIHNSSQLIPQEDIEFLKQYLIQILTKILNQTSNVTKKLLPTYRQIIFLFSKHFFKQSNSWPQLLTTILTNLQSCSSYPQVKSTLIVTKILFQILGKSLTQQIKLNNLSNRLILPLINLGAKLFSKLNQVEFGFEFFEEILKIVTEAIQFHLPEVMEQNVHMIMVLVKNVMDMRVESGNGNKLVVLKILKLKRQALIFLQKLYQRHTTSNLSSRHDFVNSFNQKYTKAFFQSIVGIIMTSNSQKSSQQNLQTNTQKSHTSNISNANFIILKHSLQIISFIIAHKQSSEFLTEELEKYQLKILFLSVEKFVGWTSKRLSKRVNQFVDNCIQCSPNSSSKRLWQNSDDFVQTYKQQRKGLRFYLSSIFTNKNLPNKDHHNTQILKFLLSNILQKSYKHKQLCLYLLTNLKSDIQSTSRDNQSTYLTINQHLKHFFQNNILDILNINVVEYVMKSYFEGVDKDFQNANKNSKQVYEDIYYLYLMKMRGYELFSCYQYLEFEQNDVIRLCEYVYSEISPKLTTFNDSANISQLQNFLNNDQITLFTQIQSIKTFNIYLKAYPQLIVKIQQQVPEIIQLYTQLLVKQLNIMRYYQEILSIFDQYISPMIYDVIQLLTDLYLNLMKDRKIKGNNKIEENFGYENQGEQEENQFGNQDQDGENGYLQQHQRLTTQQSYQPYVPNDHQQQNLNSSQSTIYYQQTEYKYDTIFNQCLASIKKIIFKHQINAIAYQNSQKLQEKLLLIIADGLGSQDQNMMKQCFSILNLLLYKGYVNDNFHYLLPMILYAFFVTDTQQQPKNQYNNNTQPSIGQQIYSQLLSYYNLTSPTIPLPDQPTFPNLHLKITKSILQNSQQSLYQISECIGCLKNYIKLLTTKINQIYCPITKFSYLNLILELVKDKFQDELCLLEGQENYNIGEILSYLSIYQTLLENKVFGDSNKSSGLNEDSMNIKSNPTSRHLSSLYQTILKWSDSVTFISQKLNTNYQSNIENPPILTTFDTDNIDRLTLLLTKIQMLGMMFYPHELLDVHQSKNQLYVENISNQSAIFIKQQKLVQTFIYIKDNLIERLVKYIKIQDDNYKTLTKEHFTENYIFLKGLISLNDVFIDTFCVVYKSGGKKQINLMEDYEDSPPPSIQIKLNKQTEVYMIFKHMIQKLGSLLLLYLIQMLQITANEYYGEKCGNLWKMFTNRQQNWSIIESENNEAQSMKKKQKKKFNNEISSKNNLEQNNAEDQSNILIQMLKSLSFQVQKDQSQQQTNFQQKSNPNQMQNSLNYHSPHHPFETNSSSSLKKPNQHQKPMQQNIISSQQSQQGSNQDNKQDPFEQFEEQYLSAYDSPIFSSILKQSKKKQLQNHLLQILNLCAQKKMLMSNEWIKP